MMAFILLSFAQQLINRHLSPVVVTVITVGSDR